MIWHWDICRPCPQVRSGGQRQSVQTVSIQNQHFQATKSERETERREFICKRWWSSKTHAQLQTRSEIHTQVCWKRAKTTELCLKERAVERGNTGREGEDERKETAPKPEGNDRSVGRWQHREWSFLRVGPYDCFSQKRKVLTEWQAGRMARDCPSRQRVERSKGCGHSPYGRRNAHLHT